MSIKGLSLLQKSQSICRYAHFSSTHALNSSLAVNNKVAILWDLDNKPPNSFPPYDVAVKLKLAASSFGYVRYMVAYANRHAFTHVPVAVKEQRRERKMLNELENRGVIKRVESYFCGVCGRRFYNNDKLINHFKQIHETEQKKRMNQIESAKGKRKIDLVAKYSMKMNKYKYAARDVLTPKVGYGLADELKRAGFWVRGVSDKPQAADVALKEHMVDMMDKKQVECIMLVSDDSDFVNILKEAKLRCLRTVVVGDLNDGALKRVSDASFSWKEIMLGKAKKEAPSVLGQWKDRDVLKKLEWTYDLEVDTKLFDSSNRLHVDCDDNDAGVDCVQKENNNHAWWKLDSDAD